jgi:hypothetical protein
MAQHKPFESLLFIDKDREDRGAVMTLGHIQRIVFIIIAGGMFQYEPPLFIQQLFADDEPGQVVDIGKGVRRSGKYEVEGRSALVDIAEHIHPDHFIILQLQFRSALLDEGEHGRIFFYHGEIPCAPGCQLIADAARSPEKVEGFQRRQVQVIFQDVEQPFFGNIRGRPGMGHFCRGVDPPAAKFAADYTHTSRLTMK